MLKIGKVSIQVEIVGAVRNLAAGQKLRNCGKNQENLLFLRCFANTFERESNVTPIRSCKENQHDQIQVM